MADEQDTIDLALVVGAMRARPLVVAYYMPHNDGVESGILDTPGQSTGTDLVDLYEVDGQIRTFENRAEAEEWLTKKIGAGNAGN
jgi:hypothetical protein